VNRRAVRVRNASTLLEIEGIDGLLVGEASLEVDRFAAIVDAASCCCERSRPSEQDRPARTAASRVKRLRPRSQASRWRLP
jgi:hypothetical protein